MLTLSHRTDPLPTITTRLVIGLFGLVGMGGVAAAPVIGRIVDRLIPWVATLVATVASLIFYAIQLGAGGVNISAVIIVCFGIDVFRQTQQVSLTTAVFGLDASARSRMNAVLIIFVCNIPRSLTGFYDTHARTHFRRSSLAKSLARLSAPPSSTITAGAHPLLSP